MEKVSVGILGSGNIGTDLSYKVLKSPGLALALVAGIDPESDGLARVRSLGVATSTEGLAAILESDVDVVIDATSAKAHAVAAPALKEAGKFVIDLTPAAFGPYVVPVVNLDDNWEFGNVNLISCAAQATIPIVHAVNRVTPVKYAEIASAVASRSAGPGTRQNIDEFTRSTASALRKVGGAATSKTLASFMPGEPPAMMRNTVYTQVAPDADHDAIEASIRAIVREVQSYVPGYRFNIEPIFEDDYVTVGIEVEGAGDYLPTYAGNLDIITCAAVAVAEKYAGMKSGQLVGGGTK